MGDTATSAFSTGATTSDTPAQDVSGGGASGPDGMTDEDGSGSTASEEDGATDAADVSGDWTGAGGTLGPYPDLSLGPYPSLLSLAVDSMLANAESYDTSANFSHSAAQGYVLQAIGELLWDAREHDLESRDALIEAALAEIAELEASADQVVGGGPAFGLSEAWDAFGDGTINPAYTAYTWQSGMVALGVAKIARVLGDLEHPEADSVRDFGVALVQRWDSSYTEVADGGYWWYSTQPSDAIAVHNTSGLVSMASQILFESGAPASLGDRPPAVADLLWARMSGNPSAGYVWNYGDDGYPGQPRPEDVSHALVTLQVMGAAVQREWWGGSQAQGVAQTLLHTMWSGHPARLHGFVDGSDGGDSEWTWSRAAIIGYAAHGDAQGGNPAVFDYARSLLFSSDLSRYERDFEGDTVGAARVLALALLLSHRPPSFAAGSAWEVVAGDADDDAPPKRPGGVRFYSVDWAAPTELARGLTLPARTSTAPNPNIVVDLDDGALDSVAVSLTYSSAVSGSIAQWDGSAYQPLGTLPATLDEDGTERWMRTTVVLDPSIAFDYQAGVPGQNLLIQLTGASVAVHRIEATPL
ncbi:MAG: hypothetical protein JKY37_08600 [Nannocystaceae bacterium]|nr:hypothetical protein [Nannocystaceae bacterium]